MHLSGTLQRELQSELTLSSVIVFRSMSAKTLRKHFCNTQEAVMKAFYNLNTVQLHKGGQAEAMNNATQSRALQTSMRLGTLTCTALKADTRASHKEAGRTDGRT